jgi:DNA primase
VIAFGARALDKDAKAKYINSPEGLLYSKSRVLYRLKQAREIAAKTKAAGLIVVEGYLDVIAFERAGMGAVAPCGTALTEEQLALVWRSGGEPVLCFDGDTAGLRAADRALELALPHLGPGKTVRIAVLPQGQDPDDVFRQLGPQALAPLIEAARPASEALFTREKNRRALDTPEARAAFKANLREAASKIAEPETRRFYLSELLRRADEITRSVWTPSPQRPNAPTQKRGPQRGDRFAPPSLPASEELKLKRAIGIQVSDPERFIRAAVDHPIILARFGEWIDRLEIHDPDLAAIRVALQVLSAPPSAPETIDRQAVSIHLTQAGEERAAARLLRWEQDRKPPGRKQRIAQDQASLAQARAEMEAEWLAYVTHEVVLPALEEELAAIRPLVDAEDPDAIARAFAIGAEKARLKASTHSAKLETSNDEPDAAEDLVA